MFEFDFMAAPQPGPVPPPPPPPLYGSHLHQRSSTESFDGFGDFLSGGVQGSVPSISAPTPQPSHHSMTQQTPLPFSPSFSASSTAQPGYQHQQSMPILSGRQAEFFGGIEFVGSHGGGGGGGGATAVQASKPQGAPSFDVLF